MPGLRPGRRDRPGVRPAPALCAAGPRLAPLVAELGCRFVTTDLALRSDGVPRVVEVGDGQASDLPPGAAGTAGGSGCSAPSPGPRVPGPHRPDLWLCAMGYRRSTVAACPHSTLTSATRSSPSSARPPGREASRSRPWCARP
ncbi:ATP-grasp domain-containing protein [Streptomyces sp. WAC 00631]|uniref:ATP-grasp domain-containing protein n=1 Tax=Streptomyces sp. WAC 00631 TaxID=2203201 RepID=UPI000F79D820